MTIIFAALSDNEAMQLKVKGCVSRSLGQILNLMDKWETQKWIFSFYFLIRCIFNVF